MSELTEKQQQIKAHLDHIEGSKIPDLQKTIDFYKKVGARKDMTQILADMQDLKNTADNLRNLLEKGPQKHEGLKVRVTEYKGSLIIETLNPMDFDEDFVPNGQGRIGCSLTNNARLGISVEAIALMKTYKRVGDVIGDLMGEEDSFTWIGGPKRLVEKGSTVCRYFKMPVGYVVIENTPETEAIEYVNKKETTTITIDYPDYQQELWIELQKTGRWKPKANQTEGKEYADNNEFVYDDFYTLANGGKGGRFVGGNLFNKHVVITNAPEGMVRKDTSYSEDGRFVSMPKEVEQEILELCANIFKKGDEKYSWDIKVHDSEIMSYINPLFDLGFDNNVMNPHETFWRMSIKATPTVMLEKLRAFKREVTA